MNIGRKIYYQTATGNVLVDTGERSGLVVETTVEQDFAIYTALQGVEQSAVGVIQCDYGYEISNFLTYPFHVDITKNPINQTAVVWDTNNPIGASLSDIQALKIAQVIDLYKQALSKGFSSSASGSSLNYDYSEDSQTLFTKLIMGATANLISYPYPINDAEGVTFNYSQDQIIQLLKDLTAFESNLQAKKMIYEAQIRACTTVEQINMIAISY